MKWGIDHKEIAKETYLGISRIHHNSFTLSSTGLHINPLLPHLGASPDGLINCSCCGEGLLEIKCPCAIHDEDPTVVRRPQFFLKEHNGGMKLSKSHNYYFQVQGQMMLTLYAVLQREFILREFREMMSSVKVREINLMLSSLR